MENKDWCTYVKNLKMSKNGFNSSDDDDDDDEDNEYDEDENNDSRSTTSSNPSAYKSNKKNKNSIKKLVNKPADQVDTKMNHKKKKTNNLDPLEHKKHKRHSNHNSLIINNSNSSSITPQTATQTTSTDETTDKKIPKKISQDSLKSSGAHYETTSDLKTNDDDNLSIDSEQLQNSYLTNKYDENYDEEEDESNEEEDEDDYQNEDDLDEDDDDDDEEDDLDDDDIWTIKPKLYSYYEKQFKIMQPDLNGFITGSVAKPFFERSRLPLNELSKIWELSDVTRDGALSFAEFCTAMHLVVLRVRNFELPNELPSKLQPYAPLIDFNTETIAANIKDRKTSADDSMLNASDQDELTLSSPTQSSTRYMNQTNQSSDKPLVFSIKPQIPSDAQIAHPVALRYTNNSNSSNQFNQQIVNTNFNEIQQQNSK